MLIEKKDHGSEGLSEKLSNADEDLNSKFVKLHEKLIFPTELTHTLGNTRLIIAEIIE